MDLNALFSSLNLIGFCLTKISFNNEQNICTKKYTKDGAREREKKREIECA